jgi:hypothetical protein
MWLFIATHRLRKVLRLSFATEGKNPAFKVSQAIRFFE